MRSFSFIMLFLSFIFVRIQTNCCYGLLPVPCCEGNVLYSCPLGNILSNCSLTDSICNPNAIPPQCVQMTTEKCSKASSLFCKNDTDTAAYCNYQGWISKEYDCSMEGKTCNEGICRGVGDSATCDSSHSNNFFCVDDDISAFCFDLGNDERIQYQRVNCSKYGKRCNSSTGRCEVNNVNCLTDYYGCKDSTTMVICINGIETPLDCSLASQTCVNGVCSEMSPSTTKECPYSEYRYCEGTKAITCQNHQIISEIDCSGIDGISNAMGCSYGVCTQHSLLSIGGLIGMDDILNPSSSSSSSTDDDDEGSSSSSLSTDQFWVIWGSVSGGTIGFFGFLTILCCICSFLSCLLSIGIWIFFLVTGNKKKVDPIEAEDSECEMEETFDFH